MIKSIVFGANGYLGRHLIHFLHQNKQSVIPTDFQPASIDNHNEYKSINVINYDEVSALDFNVDYIYVFSGLTGTNIGFEKYKSFIDVNETGLLNILEHHKNSGSRARIVFPSTRLVYKGIKDTPLTEESTKEAKTIYAQNKLSCESYLNMYSNFYGCEYTIFRICVPYGNVFSGQYSYGTVGFFLSKAKKGEDIPLFGNGDLRRTFTHVEDICKNILSACHSEESKNNCYNIGGENLSLLEAATKVALKFDTGVIFTEWPEKELKLESGDTIFNSEKIEKLTKQKNKYNFSDWIKSL